MARLREFDTDAAIDAAVVVFRQHGYEGTSIQHLVAATGIGRGSLYAAFDNKEGLYLAAVDRYRQNYADPLIELMGCGAPARELIREMLVGLVDEIVKDGTHQACLIVSAATERIHHDAQVAQRVRATTQALEDAFTALIATAQASGGLSAAGDPRDVARFLVMTTHGLRVSGAINPDRKWLMSSVDVAMQSLAIPV
jgi:TetR/AcrR family transcriptional repressor of nem operon